MSANKFHLKPGSGEPGPCSAREGNCPYGADAPHFSTEQDARSAFELAQGGSFTPEPEPLIHVRGAVLEDVAHNVQEKQRGWSGTWLPDKSGTYTSGVGRLNDIATIGGSGQAAREIVSRKINSLAKDMYKLRTNRDSDMALSARVFYDEMTYQLKENGLKDLRSDEERESDEKVRRYNNQPEGKNLGELGYSGLQEVRATASKQVADLTDAEVRLIGNHARTRGLLDASNYVRQAKTLRNVDKTLSEIATLPAHVVDALGGEEALREKAEIMAKSVNAQEQVLSRIVTDVDREIERRKSNGAVMELLKAEAK